MMRIEHASWSDAPYLADQALRLAEQTGSLALWPSYDRALELFCGWAETEYLVIAHENDEPVGFLLAWYGPHEFNPKVRALSEALWYAAHARVSIALLDHFIAWGERHADYITCSASLTGDGALRRRGFTSNERVYVREVQRVR